MRTIIAVLVALLVSVAPAGCDADGTIDYRSDATVSPGSSSSASGAAPNATTGPSGRLPASPGPLLPYAPRTPAVTATAVPVPIEIAGCASDVTGGFAGPVIHVRTWPELVSAVSTSGPRVVSIAGTIDGQGRELLVGEPDVTLAGPAALINTWVHVRSDNVILHDLRIRTGDAVARPVDADAVSVNGASDVAIDRIEAVWGPDVGGITILNDSDRVTVQYSIVGAGLRRSKHPEADQDVDGHSYALNIAGQGAGDPDCVTVYRNLIVDSAGRNPQVQGASGVDVINNVIYNFSDAPLGNPRGLNLIGNLYREGPAPRAAGLPQAHWPWKSRPSEDQPIVYESSVFLRDNAADGFSFDPVDAPDFVMRSRPAHSPSVTPEPASGLLDRVLDAVGPTPDATTDAWFAEVANRTGRYWNGCSYDRPTICFE